MDIDSAINWCLVALMGPQPMIQPDAGDVVWMHQFTNSQRRREKMPRVVHLEINADQPERAIKFYNEVFGWNITKWEGPFDYWLVTTGEDKEPGINGGLMKRVNPSSTTVNTINVPSIDSFLDKINKHGGKVIMPKTAIPGIGYHAYCQDTEGNTFGIMQEDTSAK
jgi:predicted enzyme related to lactoylglutathione lyase